MAWEYVTKNGLRFKLATIFIFLAGCVLLLTALIFAFDGFVTVGQGEFVVLVKKTGMDISNDMVVAPDEQYKGVQFEVLREGYHWRNPYTWTWSKPQPATIIPDLKVGVLTRRYGKPLHQPSALPAVKGATGAVTTSAPDAAVSDLAVAPPPLSPGGSGAGQAAVFGIDPYEVIAWNTDEKGIVPEVVLPGRHYLNTAAYHIQIADMVRVEPGFAGIVVQLVGSLAKDPGAFVVNPGERGVQPYLLPPGTHPKYSNPWLYRVIKMDTRSRKIELAKDLAIRFPSKDGFEIVTEGVIEWAPVPAKLPEMYTIFCEDKGEETVPLKEIDEKVILPLGRSFLRIEGGMHKAVDFVAGTTRIAVQSQVEQQLRTECAKVGIEIRSFVINSTEPPKRIRAQYERRELARRQRDQYEAEIVKEIGVQVMEGGKPRLDSDGKPIVVDGVPLVDGGTPKLDANGQPMFVGGRLAKEIQTRQKDRATKVGEVRGIVATDVRKAEQNAAVLIIQADQTLEVTKLKKEAATDMAAKEVALGTAEAEVTRKLNEAEAAGIEARVKAFDNGEQYARNLLLSRLAPAITGIYSNTDGPFAELVTKLLAAPTKKAAPLAAEKPQGNQP